MKYIELIGRDTYHVINDYTLITDFTKPQDLDSYHVHAVDKNLVPSEHSDVLAVVWIGTFDTTLRVTYPFTISANPISGYTTTADIKAGDLFYLKIPIQATFGSTSFMQTTFLHTLVSYSVGGIGDENLAPLFQVVSGDAVYFSRLGKYRRNIKDTSKQPRLSISKRNIDSSSTLEERTAVEIFNTGSTWDGVTPPAYPIIADAERNEYHIPLQDGTFTSVPISSFQDIVVKCDPVDLTRNGFAYILPDDLNVLHLQNLLKYTYSVQLSNTWSSWRTSTEYLFIPKYLPEDRMQIKAYFNRTLTNGGITKIEVVDLKGNVYLDSGTIAINNPNEYYELLGMDTLPASGECLQLKISASIPSGSSSYPTRLYIQIYDTGLTEEQKAERGSAFIQDLSTLLPDMATLGVIENSVRIQCLDGSGTTNIPLTYDCVNPDTGAETTAYIDLKLASNNSKLVLNPYIQRENTFLHKDRLLSPLRLSADMSWVDTEKCIAENYSTYYYEELSDENLEYQVKVSSSFSYPYKGFPLIRDVQTTSYVGSTDVALDLQMSTPLPISLLDENPTQFALAEVRKPKFTTSGLSAVRIFSGGDRGQLLPFQPTHANFSGVCATYREWRSFPPLFQTHASLYGDDPYVRESGGFDVHVDLRDDQILEFEYDKYGRCNIQIEDLISPEPSTVVYSASVDAGRADNNGLYHCLSGYTALMGHGLNVPTEISNTVYTEERIKEDPTFLVSYKHGMNISVYQTEYDDVDFILVELIGGVARTRPVTVRKVVINPDIVFGDTNASRTSKLYRSDVQDMQPIDSAGQEIIGTLPKGIRVYVNDVMYLGVETDDDGFLQIPLELEFEYTDTVQLESVSPSSYGGSKIFDTKFNETNARWVLFTPSLDGMINTGKPFSGFPSYTWQSINEFYENHLPLTRKAQQYQMTSVQTKSVSARHTELAVVQVPRSRPVSSFVPNIRSDKPRLATFTEADIKKAVKPTRGVQTTTTTVNAGKITEATPHNSNYYKTRRQVVKRAEWTRTGDFDWPRPLIVYTLNKRTIRFNPEWTNVHAGLFYLRESNKWISYWEENYLAVRLVATLPAHWVKKNYSGWENTFEVFYPDVNYHWKQPFVHVSKPTSYVFDPDWRRVVNSNFYLFSRLHSRRFYPDPYLFAPNWRFESNRPFHLYERSYVSAEYDWKSFKAMGMKTPSYTTFVAARETYTTFAQTFYDVELNTSVCNGKDWQESQLNPSVAYSRSNYFAEMPERAILEPLLPHASLADQLPGYFKTKEEAENDAVAKGYDLSVDTVLIYEHYPKAWAWSVRPKRSGMCGSATAYGYVRGG